MSKKAKAKGKPNATTKGRAKVSALLDRIKPCMSVIGGADEFSNVLHFSGRTVSAYNYKVLAQVELPGDLSVDGILDGKLLTGVLGAMPDGDVSCQFNKKEVKLLVNDSELVLQRRDSGSFMLPEFVVEEKHKSKSTALAFTNKQVLLWLGGLERCLICCDSSIMEASLLGVWVHISEDGVEMAASDGFRIGRASIGKDGVPDGFAGKTLPVFFSMDLVSLLVSAMKGANEGMDVVVAPAWVDVKTSRGRFVGMQINITKPDKAALMWEEFEKLSAGGGQEKGEEIPKPLPALLASAMDVAST